MSIAAIIGSITFLPSIALNIALACGAPLGMYAMCGRHRVVPEEVRKAFVLPIIMQFVALFVLLNAGSIIPEILPNVVTRILAFFFIISFASLARSVHHSPSLSLGSLWPNKSAIYQ